MAKSIIIVYSRQIECLVLMIKCFEEDRVTAYFIITYFNQSNSSV